jgi:hypothetical protein
LVTSGLKLAENRSCATDYRGRLYVHAAARLDWSYFPPVEVCRAMPRVETLPLGALVSSVGVYNCVGVEELPPDLAGHWSIGGRWCWLLRDARPLAEPVRCNGALRLWRFRRDVAEGG